MITGAASGMGRAFTLQLLGAGAQVAAVDIDGEGLDRLKEEAGCLPGTVWTYAADISKETSVIATVETAWSDLRGLNGLINNAGLFRDGLLVKRDHTTQTVKTMSLHDWQTVIDVDLTGPFLCTREFARHHVKHGCDGAVIINVSSVSRHGNLGQGNYSAAKAGLVADTVTWSKELARHGVRVAAIAPGFIDTPILKGMRPDALERMVKTIPLRRVGTCDEIFTGVRFIIECDYFTGRCLEIDGGLRV